MSEQIHVQPMADHEYAVEVVEGTTRTHHRVVVTQDLLDDLSMPTAGPPEEERLVRESFAFLLEKEKSTTILPEFPLAEIGSYFPDYLDAVRVRMAG